MAKEVFFAQGAQRRIRGSGGGGGGGEPPPLQALLQAALQRVQGLQRGRDQCRGEGEGEQQREGQRSSWRRWPGQMPNWPSSIAETELPARLQGEHGGQERSLPLQQEKKVVAATATTLKAEIHGFY